MERQAHTMTATERVLAACRFQRPNRIPRFDGFWSYPQEWRDRFGDPAGLSDIAIWVPLEGTFPTRRRNLREEGGYLYSVDEWGRTIRSRPGAFFYETVEVPLPVEADIDKIHFDPPDLDLRFLQGQSTLAEADKLLSEVKKQQCVFGKTGGPFLRSSFVRGEAQFLMDIAADEPLAKAIVDKVAEHLLAVGLEEMKRWSLQETGMWIYDDLAYNHGPMFSPKSFEKIFLPAYRRMIRGYKQAGAKFVLLHSDGNILPLLDMMVDAGLDGINPLERRSGMDVVKVREEYPRLILTGGMDNTDTLINGPVERVEAEARQIIDLGRQGGMIIGTHSISPEIPLEHFAAYDRVCRTYGDFTSQETPHERR